MLITRHNPLGGRPLQPGNFPLSEDRQGNFGLKLGYHDKCEYCGKGGGEPILIRTTDAESFATMLGMDLAEIKNYKKVKIPITHRIAILLIGKKTYHRLLEQEEGD